jgi:hypothetical protein
MTNFVSLNFDVIVRFDFSPHTKNNVAQHCCCPTFFEVFFSPLSSNVILKFEFHLYKSMQPNIIVVIKVGAECKWQHNTTVEDQGMYVINH